MNRLIIIPQFPAKLRYQEWWMMELPEQLENAFYDIIVLDPLFKEQYEPDSNFAPIESAIEYELEQIKEYMKLDLRNDDVLLLNDISFPGLFAQILHHKRPLKCFAFCHATSKNSFDYFSKTRNSKFPTETASSKLFDKVFVATEYHKRKLVWNNLVVTGLPDPPDWIYDYTHIQQIKHKCIAVAGRNHIQKRTMLIENKIKKDFSCNITELKPVTWDEYYTELSNHKVLLITSKEETYGYQVVDALLAGTHVLAPRKFSYPELLPDEYLYSNYEELKTRLKAMLSMSLLIPTNLMQKQADSFYNTLKTYLNE